MFASDPDNYRFLVRWKNKLDIGDTNIEIIRNKEKGFKELCISYKTIFINTYNVMLLDMKQGDIYSKNSILYRHESFRTLYPALCCFF